MKIIFFDNDCGLCLWCVRFLLKRDTGHHFHFAPLDGKTATNMLFAWRAVHPTVDSLVLLEEGQESLYYSKAVFSILWQLGFPWKVLGLLSFLPRWALFPFDLVYRLVARIRKRLCSLQDFKKAFADSETYLLP